MHLPAGQIFTGEYILPFFAPRRFGVEWCFLKNGRIHLRKTV